MILLSNNFSFQSTIITLIINLRLKLMNSIPFIIIILSQTKVRAKHLT